ncbi:DUF2284 domain-containing protein [Methanolobus profundi]|uniref:Predicted metal-binding protein n=1 Tax=Methanolobus profundi TaxID=487685 RepID=A0A1I4PQN9_9EURY|nr:DUF2284 domain-containing protein [Methanolobus profundi]SFM30142.1 Predicted metal-binding protein [Methanolobus profundi]
MTQDIHPVITKAEELGLSAYMLDASDIDVENRVRLKCAYGCRGYGKRLSCPPHIISIDEFRKMLKEYSTAILLIEEHDTSAEDDIFKAWSRLRKGSFHKMLDLEYFAFRKGFSFAQLLRPGACNECAICGEECNKPELRRFPPEAVGINLSKLMEKKGLEIEYCNFDRVKCVGILLLE